MTKEEKNEYQRNYRKNNPEKVKAYRKKHYTIHKDDINEKRKLKYSEDENFRERQNKAHKKYYEANKAEIDAYTKEYNRIWKLAYPEKDKAYRKKSEEKNKEKTKIRKKEYRKKNKEKINERARNYKKQRKLTDPLYCLAASVRSGMSKAFMRSGFSKNSKSEKILGCSIKELMAYLEPMFEPWMTWQNRGLYNGEFNYGWDIDHIIPISSAKTVEELTKLLHYTNLQPLCSRINRTIKRDLIF